MLPLEQVWQLAQAWYAGRVDEEWTPRSPAAATHVLASLGLTGEFWALE